MNDFGMIREVGDSDDDAESPVCRGSARHGASSTARALPMYCYAPPADATPTKTPPVQPEWPEHDGEPYARPVLAATPHIAAGLVPAPGGPHVCAAHCSASESSAKMNKQGFACATMMAVATPAGAGGGAYDGLAGDGSGLARRDVAGSACPALRGSAAPHPLHRACAHLHGGVSRRHDAADGRAVHGTPYGWGAREHAGEGEYARGDGGEGRQPLSGEHSSARPRCAHERAAAPAPSNCDRAAALRAEAEAMASADSDAVAAAVGAASQGERERMMLARSVHNAERKAEALQTELAALRATLDDVVASLRGTVQDVVQRIAALEGAVAEPGRSAGGADAAAKAAEISATLQDLKEATLWFWGRVLPNRRGRIELFPYLPDIEPPDGRAIVTVPCDTWLRLSYPMRKAGDGRGRGGQAAAGGRQFIWIRAQVIDSRTADISHYWAKAFDLKRRVHLIGDFTFRAGGAPFAGAMECREASSPSPSPSSSASSSGPLRSTRAVAPRRGRERGREQEQGRGHHKRKQEPEQERGQRQGQERGTQSEAAATEATGAHRATAQLPPFNTTTDRASQGKQTRAPKAQLQQAQRAPENRIVHNAPWPDDERPGAPADGQTPALVSLPASAPVPTLSTLRVSPVAPLQPPATAKTTASADVTAAAPAQAQAPAPAFVSAVEPKGPSLLLLPAPAVPACHDAQHTHHPSPSGADVESDQNDTITNATAAAAESKSAVCTCHHHHHRSHHNSGAQSEVFAS